MLYEGVFYPDDEEFTRFDGCISVGDFERLSEIARMNNMHLTNENSMISFVIREYYKEHEVAKYITSITGKEHKDYEDFVEKMKNR